MQAHFFCINVCALNDNVRVCVCSSVPAYLNTKLHHAEKDYLPV